MLWNYFENLVKFLVPELNLYQKLYCNYFILVENGPEIWAVTLSSDIFNVILASCDVEKDQAIMDHLFTDVQYNYFYLRKIRVWSTLWCRCPLKFWTYVFLQRAPFCFELTFLEFLCFEMKMPKVTGTRSVWSIVFFILFLLNLLLLWLVKREHKDS